MWLQEEIIIPAKEKGFYLITDEIISRLLVLKKFSLGICHLFIKHTSASLSINENADPSVRHDFEKFFDVLVPENQSFFKHTYEGPDDMPAHIKTSLLSTHITIPIKDGSLMLGQWQGIYLCEHRFNGTERKILATIQGETV